MDIENDAYYAKTPVKIDYTQINADNAKLLEKADEVRQNQPNPDEKTLSRFRAIKEKMAKRDKMKDNDYTEEFPEETNDVPSPIITPKNVYLDVKHAIEEPELPVTLNDQLRMTNIEKQLAQLTQLLMKNQIVKETEEPVKRPEVIPKQSSFSETVDQQWFFVSFIEQEKNGKNVGKGFFCLVEDKSEATRRAQDWMASTNRNASDFRTTPLRDILKGQKLKLAYIKNE